MALKSMTVDVVCRERIQAGEYICCGVGSLSDIPDVRGKLGDELQGSLPPGGKVSGLGGKGKSVRFVVSKHM